MLKKLRVNLTFIIVVCITISFSAGASAGKANHEAKNTIKSENSETTRIRQLPKIIQNTTEAVIICDNAVQLDMDENVQGISLNTPITTENIYNVLEYLGIDREYVMDVDEHDISHDFQTVYDLKTAIEKLLQDNANQIDLFSGTKVTRTIPYDSNADISTRGAGLSTGSLYLHTTNTLYNETRSCWGSYSGGKWTGASSGNVTGGEDGWELFGYEYKIDEIESMGLSLKDADKTIQMNSQYLVGGYVKAVGVSVRVVQNRCTYTDYYYFSKYK